MFKRGAVSCKGDVAKTTCPLRNTKRVTFTQAAAGLLMNNEVLTLTQAETRPTLKGLAFTEVNTGAHSA